jgi:hypothetical protein
MLIAATRQVRAMKGRRWLAAALAGVGVSLAFHACLAAEHDDQRQVVGAFLEAYVRQEMSKLSPYVPAKPENLFGAYPFVGLPTLSRPKVDGCQALVEFTGATVQSVLPSRGGLLFYRDDTTWKVRQVLFYEKVPRIFNLPKRSVTAKDQAREPIVAALGSSFLKAWRSGDTPALLANWYNWTRREDDPVRGLRVRGMEVSVTPISSQEAFATYKGRLRYGWGILSYSMSMGGGLFLVREGDEWKVRGNVMTLRF